MAGSAGSSASPAAGALICPLTSRMASRTQRDVHFLARDHVLVGVVEVVVADEPGRRLVAAQHPQLVPVELTKEIEQLCGLHALCFSLQVMQTRVHGIAFRRAAAIGSPQSRQMPKVPFSMR